MKTCTKCKVAKPVEEFWSNKLTKDKHYGHCKDCGKKIETARRNKNTIKEYKPGTHIEGWYEDY